MLVEDTNRSVDEFGYMTVKNCVLTGEDVAKYYGYEIPGFQALKLDPQKVYRVYRPAEEIEDADFSNKPLLSRHADFSAEDYKSKLIVGTIGDTEMNGTENHGTVVFWKKEAIEELKKGMKYLSCGYIYIPILENGLHNGIPYDIRMTKIRANHVAMVDNPRYKSAIVADEIPTSILKKGTKEMFFSKKTKTTKDSEWNFEDGMQEVYDCMTSDASEEEKEKKFDELKNKIKEHLQDTKKLETAKDKKDEESEAEKEKKTAKDKKDEGLKKEKDKEEKVAMDSDFIKKIVADQVSVGIEEYKKQAMAFDSAIRQFERTCGKVNRDSFKNAASVYDAILKNHGVVFDGKTVEQKSAMVEMLSDVKKQNVRHNTLIVGDSDSSSTIKIPDNILNFLKKGA